MNTESCVPFLRVKNARASLAYYERCLGFRKEWEHQFEPGQPLCVSVSRGGLRFFLSEHRGDGAFGACVYCYVPDVDALAAEFRENGARITCGLETMPWGTRDMEVTDLDGNHIRFGTRLSPEQGGEAARCDDQRVRMFRLVLPPGIEPGSTV